MDGRFIELMQQGVAFTLSSIDKMNKEITNNLEERGSTTSVKIAQMLEYQKVMLAVGMFSIFEARAQMFIDSEKTLVGIKARLAEKGNIELKNRLQIYLWAINVLKHGKGSSYNQLLDRKRELPFKIKSINEHFFFEGDVSEPQVLIDVDEKFVLNCVDLIKEISVEL